MIQNGIDKMTDETIAKNEAHEKSMNIEISRAGEEFERMWANYSNK